MKNMILEEAKERQMFEKEIDFVLQEIKYCLQKKNSFYKDSYKKQGLVGILTRSFDKINRSLNITKYKIEIANSESLDDTIRDIVGYGILYLKESRKASSTCNNEKEECSSCSG